jgi:tetratricopeptide (TPR) repeat protein
VAIDIYLKLLTFFDTGDDKQVNTTHENLAIAYWNWANAASKRGQWAQAADRYTKSAGWTRHPATKKRALSAKTNAEAMQYLQNGEWARAIEKFNAVLPQQDASGRKVVQTNIGSAYTSWGNALFQRQAYREALDKYEAAFEMLQGENRNLAMRNISAAYHNLTIPHLQARQPEKAVAILRSAIVRFPTCTPCRQELRDLQQRLKASP